MLRMSVDVSVRRLSTALLQFMCRFVVRGSRGGELGKGSGKYTNPRILSKNWKDYKIKAKLFLRLWIYTPHSIVEATVAPRAVWVLNCYQRTWPALLAAVFPKTRKNCERECSKD